MLRNFICFAVFLSALKVCSAANFDPFHIDEGSAAITTVALPAKPNEPFNEALSKIITSENLPRGSDNTLHNNPTERNRPHIAIIGGGCSTTRRLTEKPTILMIERRPDVLTARSVRVHHEIILRSLGVQPGHIPPPPLSDDIKKEVYEILGSELNNQN